jgi:hypothetical protein
MPAARPEIVVAITAQEPDLCGTVRTAEGADHPFTGWLGLLSALQAAMETLLAAMPEMS